MYQINPDIIKKDIDISGSNSNLKKSEQKNRYNDSSRKITYFYERDFIGALVKLPEDVSLLLTENILPEYFKDKKMSAIYKKVLEVLQNNGSINVLLSTPDIAEELSPVLMNDLDSDLYRLAAASREKILENSAREDMNRRIKNSANMDEKRKLLIAKFENAKKSLEKNDLED
jgi:DNA primase